MIQKCRSSVGKALVVVTIALAGYIPSSAQAQEGFRGERVAPGRVSTAADDVFPAVSPDGTALYFSRVKPGRGWSDQTIFISNRVDDEWTEPVVASFSGSVSSDRAPRFSPDGSQLFFSSNRLLPHADAERSDFNIWVMDLTREGDWSDPRPLSETVNTPSWESHTSITRDGSLFFSSDRKGGFGRADLYLSVVQDGSAGEAVNVGSAINSELSQTDVYVSPDGGMMIFTITNHPEGFGGDDLYVSHLSNGEWTSPRNLGAAVNTDEYEYGATLSPDGEWLYFSSHRGGNADVYRIRLSEVLPD